MAKNWNQIGLFSDQNCYWDNRTKDIRLGQQSFKEWQDSGKDLHSMVADPGFVDAAAFDFRLKDAATVKSIGFKPFDATQAGVYGSEEWKAKAKLDPAVARAFDEMVREQEAAGKKK